MFLDLRTEFNALIKEFNSCVRERVDARIYQHSLFINKQNTCEHKGTENSKPAFNPDKPNTELKYRDTYIHKNQNRNKMINYIKEFSTYFENKGTKRTGKEHNQVNIKIKVLQKPRQNIN